MSFALPFILVLILVLVILVLILVLVMYLVYKQYKTDEKKKRVHNFIFL